MSKLSMVLMALCLLGSVPMTAADIYRWTDRNGDVHFTDDESTIPKQYRENAKKIELPEREYRGSGGTQGSSSGMSRSNVDKDDQGHTADYWKARVLEARETLRAAREEKRVAEEKIMRSNPLTTSQGEITKMKESLARIDKKVQDLQKVLDVDIPDEARKAGALPGWLRVD